MASVLDGLNPEQRDAASHVEGPCLVVAGAGSGKTRMLTHRIAYLLTECDVAPWHVLAVTFTNKAAAEMRGRVDELVGPRAKRVWMGTFHSICARLLREFAEQAGLQSNFTIFDEDDRGTLLRRICRALDLDVQRFPPKQFGWRISDLKNELLDYDQYIADFDGLVTPPERVFRRVYERYQQELRAQNAVDFDDLILRAVRLVEGQPAVRAKLAERFRYVMVDEYQDINRAQYRLVRALSAEHRNLCVVGDDDQSIYGWRGARVEIILGFEDDYPEAKIVKLERNYRSTAAVLNAAGAVIARNAGRRPKTLRAVIAGGAPVRLRVAQDAADEAFYVADLIRKGQHEGRSYGDYAILYRTNAQSRAFEQVFTTARVPYRMVGGVRFYERREIRDLIAYLRALFNPTDNVSLDRIINVPARGIGNKTTEAIATRALEREISHREALATLLADDDTTLGTAARRRLLDFHQLFERLTAMLDTLPVAELVGAIFEQTGYRAALAAEDSIESAARLENIDQLVTAAHEMTEAPGRDGVEQFLERVALVSDLDSLDSSGDSVTLMTLHSAKGLEFPVVFLVGLEEGLFPHGRSLESEEAIEEERRLCYVGMTRAKEELYLTRAVRRAAPWAGASGGYDGGAELYTTPSRFLAEIPAELVEGDTGPSPGASPVANGRDQNRRLTEAVSAHRRRALGGPSAPAAAATSSRPAVSRGSGPLPSIDPAKPPFAAGERVQHATFGRGIVVNCTPEPGATVTVGFEDKAVGVKQLLVEYANLQRV